MSSGPIVGGQGDSVVRTDEYGISLYGGGYGGGTSGAVGLLAVKMFVLTVPVGQLPEQKLHTVDPKLVTSILNIQPAKWRKTRKQPVGTQTENSKKRHLNLKNHSLE